MQYGIADGVLLVSCLLILQVSSWLLHNHFLVAQERVSPALAAP